MGRTCVCLLYTYAMDGCMCRLRDMNTDSPVHEVRFYMPRHMISDTLNLQIREWD